ncbi:MAG: hypothetical protein NXI00_02045 [Cytophagales bacterium]|nr:hypothetical protein [Cytophagales bacterium]
MSNKISFKCQISGILVVSGKIGLNPAEVTKAHRKMGLFFGQAIGL